MLRRLVDHSYEGGVNGTCYGCPFASEPLNGDGQVATYEEIGNDPTEARFICSLSTRNPKAKDVPVWGEYAPCEPEEWLEHIRGRLGYVKKEN